MKSIPTQPQQTEAVLIDFKAVCALLNIGKNSFFALKQTGRFPVPAIKLGGNVRYNKGQLLRWIESGCSPAWRPRKGNP